jgi:hypothetical protein
VSARVDPAGVAPLRAASLAPARHDQKILSHL